MNERQKDLLSLLIKEHIQTATPIGSKFLVESGGLGVSSATVRNEMAQLEKEGYIYQPHHSAGRVPTAKGYQFYIDNFMEKKELAATEKSSFTDILKAELDADSKIKSLAKQVVESSQETVIVAFNKNNMYYTGLSNLFSKPEFSEVPMIQSLSEVMDHLDDRVQHIFDQVNKVEVLIGENNPFGENCATVLGKYTLNNNDEGLFMVLGPTRMDYEHNISLVEYIRDSIQALPPASDK